MEERWVFGLFALNVLTGTIVIMVAARNAGGIFAALEQFKKLCADFPTQGGQVVVALSLIVVTGLIIAARLVVGKPFPEGYDNWLIFLGALSGISNIGMIGKRATDRDLARIKAGGGPAVSVGSADTVIAEQIPAPPPPAPAKTAPPSSDGAVG